MKRYSLEIMTRLSAAVGHDLSLRLFPADGVPLRDSGQLIVASVIEARAAPTWKLALEVPVGDAGDRRAADVVLAGADEVIHVEIERILADLQAQLRAAQLKRAELANRFARPVRLVLALPDTHSNRRAVEPHKDIVSAALPVPSRRIWESIASGRSVSGDGLLWVRPWRPVIPRSDTWTPMRPVGRAPASRHHSQE